MNYQNNLSVELGDDAVNEILRLAHKAPSPRSVTDVSENSDVVKANQLANDFLNRVLSLTLQIMGHFCYTTVHPTYIAQALEYYVKFDVTRYRRSYMLDDNAGESGESEESEESGEPGESEESDNSEWNQQDAEDEIMHEDDHELESDDESDEDEDEDPGNYCPFKDYDLNNASTPMFDAAFEPICTIKLSDEAFFYHVVRPVLGQNFKCDVEFAGGADGKLKKAMYAFVVAKMKE